MTKSSLVKSKEQYEKEIYQLELDINTIYDKFFLKELEGGGDSKLNLNKHIQTFRRRIIG